MILLKKKICEKILKHCHVLVTTHGVWTGDQIYCTQLIITSNYNTTANLHLINHYHKH